MQKAIFVSLCLADMDVTKVTAAQQTRNPSYHYRIPEKTDDGWDTADLRSVAKVWCGSQTQVIFRNRSLTPS